MEYNTGSRWDTAYEWKAVALLSLGFGLVGIDRFMIMPLFPVMMTDLHLDYQDLGHITGALAVAWGISAMFMGNLSDRIGHRKVIIPAIIVFSLLAGLSGLATGVGSLILIRAVMGFAEGAYTPASIIATLDASRPTRHGRNIGIQQMALPLFGLGIAPILVTQLLKVLPWHWIFAVVSIPGLLVAYLMLKVLRNTQATSAAQHTATHDATTHKWTDVFRYRNIPLNIVGMLCWLTCLVVLSALFPSYLIDYLHLSMQQMGYVLSAIGFGGTLGTLVMPALSDRLGQKAGHDLLGSRRGRLPVPSHANRCEPVDAFHVPNAHASFRLQHDHADSGTVERGIGAGEIDVDGFRAGGRHRRSVRRRTCPGDSGLHREAFRHSVHHASRVGGARYRVCRSAQSEGDCAVAEERAGTSRRIGLIA